MDLSEYRATIKAFRASKKLGQNFLISKEVAKTEANFGMGRNVVELGPGFGMLTMELCKTAKKVLAIEKDRSLFDRLSEKMEEANLEMMNTDFFKVPKKKFADSDIMIANIPYNLSSKTLLWLGEMKMPAVLCLQKEFVEHMTAKPNGRNYSRLSVMCALQFSLTYIMDVPANDFYPEPKVASSLIYLRPGRSAPDKELLGIVSLIMEHKKKKIRNGVLDSKKKLGLTKETAEKILPSLPHSNERAFKLTPEELLDTAEYLAKHLKN